MSTIQRIQEQLFAFASLVPTYCLDPKFASVRAADSPAASSSGSAAQPLALPDCGQVMAKDDVAIV